MKHTIKQLTATAAVIMITVASAASGAPVTNAQALLLSSVGSEGNVRVTVQDGVATLDGYADNQTVVLAAKRALLRADDIREVESRVIYND